MQHNFTVHIKEKQEENLEFFEVQTVDFTFANVSENKEIIKEEVKEDVPEKKIKLANIRGIKPQSLFDEETLHQLALETIE